MIKYTRYIILSFVFSLISLNIAYSFENKILLKVNNEIVTSLDILKELEYLHIINKEFKNIKKEEAIEISKNSIIREKIKEIEIILLISACELKVVKKNINRINNIFFIFL